MIDKKQFEKLLLANWGLFIDKTQLIKLTLESIVSNNFRQLVQDVIPKTGLKIQITKFEPKDDHFLIWIEFSAPKEKGVVVGEHEAKLTPSGSLKILETSGTHFIPKQH